MPVLARCARCGQPSIAGTDPPACYGHAAKKDKVNHHNGSGLALKPTVLRVLVVEVPIRDGETAETLAERLRAVFHWRGPLKIYEKERVGP